MWGEVWETHAIIAQDPAFQNYLEFRNRPLRDRSIASAKSAVRDFLTYLRITIRATALSELIRKTRTNHRGEDFATDRKLTAFGKGSPSTNGRYVGYLKAIFEKNDCPLTKAFAPPQATRKTKRISAGILKAIYDSLPRDELRLLKDLCTLA